MYSTYEYLYFKNEYGIVMDIEEIRKILDTKTPEEIRAYIKKQEVTQVVKPERNMQKNDFFRIVHLLLMPVFLTVIFLLFFLMTSDPSASQILLVVYVISFILLIILSIKMIQNKSRQVHKKSS